MYKHNPLVHDYNMINAEPWPENSGNKISVRFQHARWLDYIC